MARKKKRTKNTKARWGFWLNLERDRDLLINGHLDSLAYDEDASEYIRGAIYTRMQMDRHAPDTGPEPTLFDVAAQIEDLKRKLESMQFAPGGERPVSVPEMDDERAARIGGKLIDMKFTRDERRAQEDAR